MKPHSFLKKIIDALLRKRPLSQIDKDVSSWTQEEKDLYKTARLLTSSRHADEQPRVQFKQELREKIMNMLQEKHVLKTQKKKKQKKSLRQLLHLKAFTGVGVAVTAIAVVVAVSLTLPSSPFSLIQPGTIGGINIPVAHAHDNFTIEPTLMGQDGVVHANTAFRVESKAKISKRDLENYLALSSGQEYEVNTIESGYVFEVVVDEALQEGTVIQITVDTLTTSDQGNVPYEYSWAFEVTEKFKVHSTVPDNQTTGYPANDAVQILFTHAEFVDPSAYVSVIPEHPYRIETHGRSVHIIPELPWEQNEVYTVTIAQGFGARESIIPSDADEKDWQLQDNLEISFTPGSFNYDLASVYVYDAGYHSRPGEEIQASASIYRAPENTDLDLTVYRIQENELLSVIDDVVALEDWLPASVVTAQDDQLLTRFNERTPERRQSIDPHSAQYSTSSFTLPVLNDTGVYLVVLEIHGQKAVRLWSVSEIGASITLSETRGYIWTVNTASNQPQSNVELMIDGEQAGSSNSQGVIELNQEQIESMDANPVFVFTANGQTTVQVASIWRSERAMPEYDGFLLLDKYLHEPSGVVRAWGRVTANVDVNEVSVSINGSSLRGGYGRQETFGYQTVEVDRNGFYATELDFTELPEGYYHVEVHHDDYYVSSQGFDVRVFAVPELSINVTPKYGRIDAGFSNEILISATRFDGNPAAGIDLALSGYIQQSVVTDSNGEYVLQAPSQVIPCNDGYCYNDYESIEVRALGAFSGESYGYASWTVSQNYLDTKIEKNERDGEVVITATAEEIIYEGFDRSYDTTRKPIVSRPYRIDLYEITTIQGELQTEYDPDSNQSQFYYDFSRRETIRETVSAITDEQGRIEWSFTPNERSNYRVEISVLDKHDRFDRSAHYIDLVNLPYGKVYVESEETAEEEALAEYAPYEYLDVQIDFDYDQPFKVGDDVDLTILLGETGQVSDSAQVFLYTVAPNLVNYQTFTGSKTSLRLIEEFLPNVQLGAVVLQNGRLYDIEWMHPIITLDEDEYRLDVEVTPEATSASVRDEIEVEVIVRDKLGNPVQGQVQLSVLDSAFLDIESYVERRDPLQQLFRRVYDRLILQTATHKGEQTALDGLGGGGGDVRSQFLDLAHYQVVSTDASGRAVTTITLADNVTTWKLYAAAADTNRQAGLGESEIVVDQSIVVEAIASESYLNQDDIALGARTFVPAIQDITYHFYAPILVENDIESLDDFPVANEVKTISSSDTASFNVGKLAVGRYAYAIRVEAEAGDDAIIKTFNVIENRALQAQTEQFSLSSETWTAPAPKQPTNRISLQVTSPLGSEAYRGLVQAYSAGRRLDTLLATQKANALIDNYFIDPSNEQQEALVIPSEYKIPRGGLARFPYGGLDMEMTAAAFSLIQPDLSVLDTTDLLAENLETQRGGYTIHEFAWMYKALAAAKAPGLQSLKSYINDFDDLHDRTRLVFADALLLYGDKEGAREQAELVNRESLTIEDAELLTVILVSLGDKEWKDLYDEFNLQRGFVHPDLAVRFWEQRLLQQPVLDASFIVTAGEEQQFVSLQGLQSFRISVTPDQLATIRLDDIKGNLEAVYEYEAGERSLASINGLSVTRQYLQNGISVDTIDSFDDIEVEIIVRAQSELAYGGYTIEDILPSALKGVTRGYGWNYSYENCERRPYKTTDDYAYGSIFLDRFCPSMVLTYNARLAAEDGVYIAPGTEIVGYDIDGRELRHVLPDQQLEIRIKE